MDKKIGTCRLDSIKKSMYVKSVWTVKEDSKLTLKELVAGAPNLKIRYICGNPTIIAKETQKGKIFYKMEIPLKGGNTLEYELSYSHSFNEGDIIDQNSLEFWQEVSFEDTHDFVTGRVIEEDEDDE